MGMDALSLLAAAQTQEHSDAVMSTFIAGCGVVLSIFASWLTALWTLRADERRALREGNMRLLEWAIEHPFLEDDEFCSTWPNTNRGREDNLRYDNYCCHVFNLLEQCWAYCHGDVDKMQHILFPDELIGTHRVWWQRNGHLNKKAYPDEFTEFVSFRILALEKEKEHEQKSATH